MGTAVGLANHTSQVQLRRRIEGVKHINGILRVLMELRGADKDEVPALQARLRGHEILLKKILPDLKAVEHSIDPNSELPMVIMADLGGAQPFKDGDTIDGDFYEVDGRAVGADAGAASTVRTEGSRDFSHIFE